MKRFINNLLSLFFIMTLLGSAGCSSSGKVVQADTRSGTGASSNISPITFAAPPRIWVLNPKLTYEDVKKETPLDASQYNGPQIVRVLTDAGLSVLHSKGVRDARTVLENLPTEMKAQAELASASAQRLFLSKPDPQVVQAIQRLGGTNEPAAVLVQYLRVKVGPGGFYDPFTGDLSTSASTTHLRAGLVDCQTGCVLWRNSVLLREVPKPDSPDLARALQQLYSTLNFQP